jgi:Xaa-Pro aminopeptidase
MSQDRLDAVRASMETEGLEALIVTKRENIRYLSGFSGDSGVGLVTRERSVLVTDGRFREQAKREAGAWQVEIYSRDLMKALADVLADVRNAGIEDSSTLAFNARAAKALAEVDLRPTDGLVEALRTRKDDCEIEMIRAAAKCAEQAWSTLLPMLQPGVTERQLASSLDYRMMSAGADGPAFDTVVASGPNSSMPHAAITDRELAEGDLVVIDFGARKDGYCCDLTRTVGIGDVEGRGAGILFAVSQAFDAAFAKVEPGVPVAEVDRAARDHLTRIGLGEAFSHSLGHGVGLEVHEKPSLSQLSEDTLEPGMVFTIEPGVYLDGDIGARYEQTVLLTEEGPEVLT